METIERFAALRYHTDLGGHSIPPSLIRRRPRDLQSTVFFHTSEITTGSNPLRVDSLSLEFPDSQWIISDPDDGLGLPHGRVVECVVVESGSVAVWRTGLVVLLVGGEVVVVDFALTGMGGRLGSGKTDLVGHSTGTAVLDSVGRVSV